MLVDSRSACSARRCVWRDLDGASIRGASIGGRLVTAHRPSATATAICYDGDDNGRGDVIAIGCTLVVIRGARVFVADVARDGALSTFEPAPSLPEPQIDVSWGDGHQEGASWGLARGHVHVAGPRRVYSSEILARAP